MARSALVVFVDHADTRWLRLLQPGYRHCFAAFQHSGYWLLFDPLLHRLRLDLIDLPSDFDLAGHYVRQGHRVLCGEVGEPARPILFRMEALTCVSLVKRAIGLVAPAVVTPKQLFRRLTSPRPNEPIWRQVGAQPEQHCS